MKKSPARMAAFEASPLESWQRVEVPCASASCQALVPVLVPPAALMTIRPRVYCSESCWRGSGHARGVRRSARRAKKSRQ